jgi:nonribosomal peptide synthetase MxcG
MSGWPLTQAQQGIWLGQAKSPDSTRYNTAEYLELNVALNAQSWLDVASNVLQNCTALNVQFIEAAGELLHLPLSHAKRIQVNGEYLDLSKEVCPTVAAKQFLNEWQAKPFDLSEGRLYRHVLIKLATNQYFWALGAHHIALDGFSFALLTNRVLAAYEGEDLQTGALQTDESQYLAVLEEDHRYQQSQAFEHDKTYWLNKLKHLPNAATLRTLDEQGGDNKVKVSSTLSASLIARLDTHAQQVGANWSELLLAAVALVIYEQRGVADTILGLPVSNRFGSKAANTPCMHMNIVPVCVRFDLCETFAALLKHVSGELKQARRHFRFRYEALGGLAKAHHLPTRLFGPVVNILPFERSAECEGEPVINHTLSAGPVDDLAFVFIKHADGSLRFELEGQQSSYSQFELSVLQQQLERVLASLYAGLNLPLQITNSELAMIATPFAPCDSRSLENVISSFFDRVKASHDAIALRTVDGQTLSYALLAEQVSKLAEHIHAEHLRAEHIHAEHIHAEHIHAEHCHAEHLHAEKPSDFGHTIVLLLPRSINTIIAMLAVLAAKQRFVFIDVEAPLSRNQRIIADAKPILALVDDNTQGVLAEFDGSLPYINVAKLTESKQEFLGQTELGESISLSDEAYLIYTSGSTGQPKGVQINHGALAGFIAGAREAYGVTADDKVLQFAPFHFDACIEEVFLTLTTGATLVLRNDAMLDSFEAFIAEIERLAITVLDLPTAYWHELSRFACESKLTRLGQVHTIIIGGEAVNRHHLEAWRKQFGTSIRVLNTYGPTETTVVATYVDLSQTNATNTIGKPLPGRSVVVMRERGQIANLGERGELYLTGAGLATGYLGQVALTDSVFVPFWNPSTRQFERAYRTGDIVRLLGHGELEYLGREDAQLKISGYRIELGEIEAVMLEHPAIVDVAITILRDSEGQPKALAAHLVSREEWSLDSLRSHFATKLPAPMLPVQVSYYSSLPKTPANKIDRKRLAAAFSAQNQQANLSEFESLVAGVWREVLGIACINKEDNFFSIGGQSLQCIQVAARLSKLLNKPVTVAFLFAHPKLCDLCDALQGKGADTDSQISASGWQTSILEDITAFQARLAEVELCKRVKLAHTTVLLTGATGFVGAQLLSVLLAIPDVKVICHVRADTIEAAEKRLRKACQQQQLGTLDFTRVEILLADLSAQQLGLSEPDYEALGLRVTHVIHNAAHTSVLRDYSSLKAANTQSTAELLLFAKRFGLYFNHVSTVAVAPLSDEPLVEAFVPLHHGLKDGYQRSKWAAERCVELAMEAGVTAQVYRLARVIGDKHTGFINSNDLVWRILRTGLKLGSLPQLVVSEPWTPVDIVARFVVSQSLLSKNSSVFNVTPDSQVFLSELYAWLSDLGFAFQTVAIKEWVALAEQSTDEDDLTIASFFQAQAASDAAALDAAAPGAALDATPISLNAHNERFKRAASSLNCQLGEFQQQDFIPYLRFAFSQQLLSEQQYFAAALNVHSAHFSHSPVIEEVAL